MKKSIPIVILLAFVLSSGAYAQTPDYSAEVDKIFAWTKPDEPGCAVALSQNGKLVINKAYGSADLERDTPISPNTLFDAGSVRKQFVAAAILLLAGDGKLALTDDVRKYIPELPDYGRKITVDHLLTHTSGVRDWQPLLNLAGGDPTAMTMILRQRELNFIPGDEWSYSNSGYVLLPEIVTRVSAIPFSEFLQKRVLGPAGMKSSVYVDDPLFLIKNRALAYSKAKDRWKLDMYLGNERGGAGALFTTAVDLVAWNDALAADRLGAGVTQKLQEPAVLNNGRKLSYARGLQLEPFRGGGYLIWHSGGAAGYSSMAGRISQHNLSIAITCNQDGTARSAFAARLFDLFLPAESNKQRSSPSNTPVIEAGDLSGRAGMFFEEKTGRPLRIEVNNNGALTIPGGGPLAAIGADRFKNQRTTPFFMSEAELELRYVSPDRIELKTQEGLISHYRRARAWAPSEKDLKELAGRYRSDELTAVFEAAPTNGGLNVRANDANTIEFKPAEKDTFQFNQSLLKFVRNAEGKVVGLEYTNPMLRAVKFARVGDRF